MRIAVALVVFIKTPTNHIFFKSLIIPDYGFELTKTIYLNVFRNWNALCKSTCLYKSCSTPAGNKRKKTINTAFALDFLKVVRLVFWSRASRSQSRYALKSSTCEQVYIRLSTHATKKPCLRFLTSAFVFLLLTNEVGEGN